jgi:type I restriction enzyme S subunit
MKSTGQHFLSMCREKRTTDKSRKYQPAIPMFDASLPKLLPDWTWASLSELCERVSVGHVGPTSEFFTTKEEGIQFVRSQDVRPGRLMLGSVTYVTRSFHEKLKKSQLKAGDILVVRVGANRGDTCVVPVGVGSVNCANIVFARPMVLNGFIGLFLRSDLGQSLLASLTTGSAQGVLNTQSIAAMPIPVPPLPTQRKIASILSAYDDLIENNTRRIAILEAIAQAIYREWFVEFRFPGHEKVKFVDSPMGKIPEGWKSSTLGACAQFLSGGTPSKAKKQFWEGTIPWVSSGELKAMRVRDTSLHVTEEAVETGSRLVHPETILAVVRGMSLAKEFRVAMVSSPVSFNQDIKAIVPRADTDAFFLFHSLMEKRDHIRDSATEATHGTKKLDTTVLVQLPLIAPPEVVQKQFRSIVAAIHSLFDVITLKNMHLRTTRDLLLPKLISGHLDIEDLDIDIGENAATEEVAA